MESINCERLESEVLTASPETRNEQRENPLDAHHQGAGQEQQQELLEQHQEPPQEREQQVQLDQHDIQAVHSPNGRDSRLSADDGFFELDTHDLEAPAMLRVNTEEGELVRLRANSAELSYSHARVDGGDERALSSARPGSRPDLDLQDMEAVRAKQGQDRKQSDPMSQGAEVQEAMFRQALSLLDERCISRDSTRGRQIMAQLTQAYPSTPIQHSRSHTRSVVTLTEPSVIALRDDMETPLVSLKQHTYGQHRPEYFYVHQRKPTPMPPLQAWKGYYGNVYFAPISVQPARPVPPPRPPQQHLASCSDKLQAILLKQRRLSTSPQHSRSRSVTSRHTTGSAGTKGATESNPRHPSASSTHSRRQSQPVQSRASMRSWFSGAKSSAANSTVSRQMSRLYKSVVLNDFNENISEDVTWINGLESTGTLLFDPGVQPEKRQPRSPQPPREKLRRGSTTLARSQSTKIYKHEYPELDVKGGRCSEPKPNSLALLRSRTELPFSKYNRLPFKSTTSDYGQISPMAALSGIRSNEVPSMDQLRASLRQMENVATKDELIRMVPTSQRRAHSLSDMKRVPYVKFSPEYRVPHPPTNHSICV